MRTKPTAAVTRPEKKVRLSGDSVRVSTRDQTMFTEKHATQIMHAANPIQSPWRALPHGSTAMTTPANPTTMADPFCHDKPSLRNTADSRAMTMGAVKTKI